MMIWLITLTTLTVTSSASAQSVFLEKDKPAPFAGILLPREMAESIRRADLELEFKKFEVESLNKKIELFKQNDALQNDKVNVLLTQNTNLSKSLFEERTVTMWERVAWFGLGVVATSLAVYGTKKITQ